MSQSVRSVHDMADHSDPTSEPATQDHERVPLGAVVIPPGEVSPEERKALAKKLYERMMGKLSATDAEQDSADGASGD